MPTSWTQEHVAGIARQDYATVDLITAQHARPVLPGLVLWDMWPVQCPDGTIANINGGSLWMVLAAPRKPDPFERHFEARIRLLHLRDDQWRDLGWALPDGDYPFAREWSGTALLEDGQVTLYFTAAGIANELGGYQQRLFEAHGTLRPDGKIADWSPATESVSNNGEFYKVADQLEGEPGKITAFRDPAYFRDPADGQEYLLFTATLAESASEYDGAVGIARRSADGQWELLPPLLHADGVNKELERAHVVFKDGLYYLFWVTQAHTFDPAGSIGPTGLYGMVSRSLFGPYAPLNGTGLVLANPKAEPRQTYSWHVTGELLVSSFIEHWGLNGRDLTSDAPLTADSFGGVPAPFVKLFLDGDRAGLSGEFANAIRQ